MKNLSIVLVLVCSFANAATASPKKGYTHTAEQNVSVSVVARGLGTEAPHEFVEVKSWRIIIKRGDRFSSFIDFIPEADRARYRSFFVGSVLRGSARAVVIPSSRYLIWPEDFCLRDDDVIQVSHPII